MQIYQSIISLCIHDILVCNIFALQCGFTLKYLHSDITPYSDEYPSYLMIIIVKDVMTISLHKNRSYPHDPQSQINFQD